MQMPRLSRRAVAVLAVAILRPRAAPAAGAAIGIDNFVFTPPALTVARGTGVVFTNNDDIPHSVVSALSPPAFRSHVLDTGDAFTMVFDKPGVWGYFCGLHPHMQGTVTVT
jgi:plastocyanin